MNFKARGTNGGALSSVFVAAATIIVGAFANDDRCEPAIYIETIPSDSNIPQPLQVTIPITTSDGGQVAEDDHLLHFCDPHPPFMSENENEPPDSVTADSGGTFFKIKGSGTIMNPKGITISLCYNQRNTISGMSIYTSSSNSNELVCPTTDNLQCIVGTTIEELNVGRQDPNNVCHVLNPPNLPFNSYTISILDIGDLYTLWITNHDLSIGNSDSTTTTTTTTVEIDSVVEVGMSITEYDIPSNIRCENAIPIGTATPTAVYEGTMTSKDYFFPDSSSSNFNYNRGRWYSIQGTGNILTVTSCTPQTKLDVTIEIYSTVAYENPNYPHRFPRPCNMKSYLDPILTNNDITTTPIEHTLQCSKHIFEYTSNDNNRGNHPYQLSFFSKVDETYLIHITSTYNVFDDDNDEDYSFGIMVMESTAPINDDCERAIDIISSTPSFRSIITGTTDKSTITSELLVGLDSSSLSTTSSSSSSTSTNSCNLDGNNGEGGDDLDDPCRKQLSTMDLMIDGPNFNFVNEAYGHMFSVTAKETDIKITDLEFAKATRGVGPIEIVTEIYYYNTSSTTVQQPNFYDLQRYEYNTTAWILLGASKQSRSSQIGSFPACSMINYMDEKDGDGSSSNDSKNPLIIQAGETGSFYIHVKSGSRVIKIEDPSRLLENWDDVLSASMQSPDSSLPPVYAQDDHLQLHVGISEAYYFSPNTIDLFSPPSYSSFLGTIHYQTLGSDDGVISGNENDDELCLSNDELLATSKGLVTGGVWYDVTRDFLRFDGHGTIVNNNVGLFISTCNEMTNYNVTLTLYESSISDDGNVPIDEHGRKNSCNKCYFRHQCGNNPSSATSSYKVLGTEYRCLRGQNGSGSYLKVSAGGMNYDFTKKVYLHVQPADVEGGNENQVDEEQHQFGLLMKRYEDGPIPNYNCHEPIDLQGHLHWVDKQQQSMSDDGVAVVNTVYANVYGRTLDQPFDTVSSEFLSPSRLINWLDEKGGSDCGGNDEMLPPIPAANVPGSWYTVVGNGHNVRITTFCDPIDSHDPEFSNYPSDINDIAFPFMSNFYVFQWRKRDDDGQDGIDDTNGSNDDCIEDLVCQPDIQREIFNFYCDSENNTPVGIDKDGNTITGGTTTTEEFTIATWDTQENATYFLFVQGLDNDNLMSPSLGEFRFTITMEEQDDPEEEEDSQSPTKSPSAPPTSPPPPPPPVACVQTNRFCTKYTECCSQRCVLNKCQKRRPTTRTRLVGTTRGGAAGASRQRLRGNN